MILACWGKEKEASDSEDLLESDFEIERKNCGLPANGSRLFWRSFHLGTSMPGQSHLTGKIGSPSLE